MAFEWIAVHERMGEGSDSTTWAANVPDGVLIRAIEERWNAEEDDPYRPAIAVSVTFLPCVRVTDKGDLVRQEIE